jgi:hypothetical protein
MPLRFRLQQRASDPLTLGHVSRMARRGRHMRHVRHRGSGGQQRHRELARIVLSGPQGTMSGATTFDAEVAHDSVLILLVRVNTENGA